jgi:hypothetical protein
MSSDANDQTGHREPLDPSDFISILGCYMDAWVDLPHDFDSGATGDPFARMFPGALMWTGPDGETRVEFLRPDR